MKLLDKLFGLSTEKQKDLDLIFHFQRMLAMQQLLMERYNDAHATAAGLPEVKGEAFSRQAFLLDDPDSVAEHIIPALEEKVTSLESMDSEHRELGEPESGVLKSVYTTILQTYYA